MIEMRCIVWVTMGGKEEGFVLLYSVFGIGRYKSGVEVAASCERGGDVCGCGVSRRKVWGIGGRGHVISYV